MMHFFVSAFGNGDYRESDNPTFEDVISLVNNIEGACGVYDIERVNPPDLMPMRLNIEYCDGRYLPAICFLSGEVFFYKNLKADDGWIKVACYEYPMEILTDDFDLIVSMVKEFYETGTVKILNHQYDFSKSDRV